MATKARSNTSSSNSGGSAAGELAGKKIGPYLVERRLGIGGMAEIFLARKPLGTAFKQVVVKRMLPHLAQDARFVDMFMREAGILASLNHVNVVHIFDLGTTDIGELYIAMEYLEGINVQDLATRAWRARRPLPVELVLRLLAEAARGLDHVHRQRGSAGEHLNLVHRDIAPDNLFFVRDGTLKLLDFGVARGATMKLLTTKGELKGKLPYMAPEQLDSLDLDGRADLYSLGVTIYWLLTGVRPFRGADEAQVIRAILRTDPVAPSLLNRAVPEWLDELVLRMLAKNREERTQTGGEIEELVARNARARLDRMADVRFLDELLAFPDNKLDDVIDPIPAALRPIPSDVFARVDVRAPPPALRPLPPAPAPMLVAPAPPSMLVPAPISVLDGDVASASADETLRLSRGALQDHMEQQHFQQQPQTAEAPLADVTVDEKRTGPWRAMGIDMPEIEEGSDTVRVTESQLIRDHGGDDD